MRKGRVRCILIVLYLASIYIIQGCSSSIAENSNYEELTVDSTDTRPNVVLVLIDDLGADALSMYGGSSFRTPELDRISKAGMVNSGCFSMPVCTPSHAKLLTGKYNYKNFRNQISSLDTTETTIGDIFQQAGYETFYVGKDHMMLEARPNGGWYATPNEFGFENYQVPFLIEKSFANFYPPQILKSRISNCRL